MRINEKTRHERLCRPISYEAGQEHRRKEELRTFICTLPGCSSTFPTKPALCTHVSRHKQALWTSKPYKHRCSPGKLLNSRSTYYIYTVCSSTTEPTQPEHPQWRCLHDTIYQAQLSLLSYMLTAHNIKNDVARKILAAKS